MRTMFTRASRLFSIGLCVAALSLAADRSLVGLIGPDADMVAGIQMDNIRGTAIGQTLLQRLPFSDPSMQRFVRDSGFDPRRDIQEVVFGVSSKQHAQIVALRGSFDMAKIAALVKREGATMTKSQGYDVITSPDNHATVVFIEPTVVLMGPPANVKAALERRQSGMTVDPATLDRVDRASGGNDVWFVSNNLNSLAAPGGRQAVAGPFQAFNALQQMSGGLRLGSVVQISVEAAAKTEKDALALADVLRMLPALAGSQATPGNKAEAQHLQAFVSVMDKAQVQASGTTVKLVLPIPQNQVEQWLQEMNQPRTRVRKTADRR